MEIAYRNYMLVKEEKLLTCSFYLVSVPVWQHPNLAGFHIAPGQFRGQWNWQMNQGRGSCYNVEIEWYLLMWQHDQSNAGLLLQPQNPPEIN